MANAKASANQVKKFDTVTDKSTKALLTATNNLTKVLGDMQQQVDLVEELSEEIQVKQDQRDNLDKELGIKVREHEAELALQIRENKEKVIVDLLEETGRADITKADAEDLERELLHLQETQQKAIHDAVASANSKHEAEMEALENQLKADHAVETASLKADKASLQDRLGYLTEQVNTYKQMLDDERKARVDQSEAAARAAEANRAQATARNS
jgi:hypothetical protein